MGGHDSELLEAVLKLRLDGLIRLCKPCVLYLRGRSDLVLQIGLRLVNHLFDLLNESLLRERLFLGVCDGVGLSQSKCVKLFYIRSLDPVLRSVICDLVVGTAVVVHFGVMIESEKIAKLHSFAPTNNKSLQGTYNTNSAIAKRT